MNETTKSWLSFECHHCHHYFYADQMVDTWNGYYICVWCAVTHYKPCPDCRAHMDVRARGLCPACEQESK
jgi:hypothetical protein